MIFFVVGRDDEDRAEKRQRLQTQAVGPLHDDRFLKTMLAFRSGVVDLRQRAQRAKLLVALLHRLDQLARLPLRARAASARTAELPSRNRRVRAEAL